MRVLLCVASATVALSGCGPTIVVARTPAAATRVDYDVRLRVGVRAGEQGDERTSGGQGARASAEANSRATASVNAPRSGGPSSETGVLVDPRIVGEHCAGVTVDETGETRNGRALGMGLLQVYAQPEADLFVDEQPQGSTPLIAVGVDAGPRDVRLRNLAIAYDCTFRLRVLPGIRYAVGLDAKPR